IDPNYGTLIRRVTIPGDAPLTDFDLRRKAFTAASGTNWTNPTASLADDSNAATSNGTQDWLAATDPQEALSAAYVFGQAIDSVTVRIKGSAQGSSAQQRTIEACLTIDGATCQTGVRSVQLETSQSVKTLGGDTWGGTLWLKDVSGNARFGLLIRPA